MPLEKNDIPTPFTFTVDMSQAWDTKSEAKIFIKELKKQGLYSKNLLYCGFDGAKDFRTTGKIYATWEDDLQSTDVDNANPIEFATEREHTKPAIAIIDATFVSSPPDKKKGPKDYAIKLKDPSAVIAIAYLKYK